MSKSAVAHTESGGRHNVVAELRVLVSPSPRGDYFVAQGLDVDYVVTGANEQEVRDRFAEGFIRTVYSMLLRGRDLANLLTKSTAPPEAFEAYEAARAKPVLLCRGEIDLSDRLPSVPAVPRKVVFRSAVVA